MAKWNDNIKRTAVWRCRNESLLKAMRNTLDFNINIDDLGASNAHQTYLGLKSRYHVSDNQKAMNLYNDELIPAVINLDDSPREIADDFQATFDQYNHLFDHKESQRLPENFLKLEFLSSLETVYADWIKALLKEHDVLGLDQGPTLTFNELVDLVIVERGRLLQAQMDASAYTSASRQSAKRNISQVEDVSQPEPRADQEYLADHPEIEGRQYHSASPSPLSHDHKGDARQDTIDDECRASEECDTDSSSTSGQEGVDSTPGDEEILHDSSRLDFLRNRDWERLAMSCFAQVRSQKEHIMRIKTARSKGDTREEAYLGSLSGEWLLYAQYHNPGEAGYHHIQLWETTAAKHKHKQPTNSVYAGRLTIGPYKNPETFQISNFVPPSRVKNCSVNFLLKQAGGTKHKGKAIFWGNGKALFTLPAPCHNTTKDMFTQSKFAGVQSDEAVNATGGHRNDGKKHDGDEDGEMQEADQLEWAQLADARLAKVEAQKNAASKMLKAGPKFVARGPFPGLWRLYASSYNPGEDGYHYLTFWGITTQPDSGPRQYRGELSTGPSNDVTVHQMKQFSLPNKIIGSVIHLFTITGNTLIGNMTLWGKGQMYVHIHSSHMHGYDGSTGWFKFAGIWNEAGKHLPWKEVKRMVEKRSVNGAAASHETQQQIGGGERYDLVVRAEKDAVVAVKMEDKDTDMAAGDQEDQPSIVIKTEGSDSGSDDFHDECTDDVTTTDDAVQKQEAAIRQGLTVPLHALSGKWYFHSANYNPGLDKDISITFYDRQVHNVSERMCAPGHCKSTPAQIHYCGELRFKAPNGERDFHCFIKQFDVPKRASLDPVVIELWELYNKRAIFVAAWFPGAGTMRMSIPTAYLPSYQGQNTLVTFDGLKYGWTSHAG
ncbi:hypothetical protein D6C84_03525 [Aureobasidium pullulans]|uniref:Uncharacterized protein n=1 Tax=Aureobasidium pullulans TaxID=5580 RepID=A0A4S9XXS2_AURPU|nr:hypothetical protein D6C84_03525 [Aureobasidium pullulans]